jgi:hypothetical protein
MYVSTMCGIHAECSHIELRYACSHHYVLKSARLLESALQNELPNTIKADPSGRAV